MQEAEAGLVSPPDTVAVGAEDRLGVSDLVLGVATSNLRWLRSSEDTVYFNPAGGYRASSPLLLFFEVLGMKPGESYKTEIKVSRPGGLGPIGRLFRGGGGGITIRNEELAGGTRIPVARELDLGRLRPGNYVLEVTVEQGGRKVRRRSPFQVVGAPAPAPAPLEAVPPSP